MKTFTLGQFLTDAQITEALKLYETYGHWDSVVKIESAVIEPNMTEINKKLGHTNDARYLAYAVVYVFMQDQVN